MSRPRIKKEYADAAALQQRIWGMPTALPPHWFEGYVKPEPLSPEARAKFDAAFLPKE